MSEEKKDIQSKEEEEKQKEQKQEVAEAENNASEEHVEKEDSKEEKEEKKESGEENKTEDEKGTKKRAFPKKRTKKPFLKKKKKFTRRRKEERKQEFEQKIISMRRVTRVVAGGRRFSFSVAIVIGDKKGRVGVGLGKSNDTSLAIEKAVRDAKANLITVKRTEEGSIPFDVEAKFGSSIVEVRPAPGRGLVAGASVRTVLDLAGVTDVTSKIWTRSKNQLNIARATIEALKKLEY